MKRSKLISYIGWISKTHKVIAHRHGWEYTSLPGRITGTDVRFHDVLVMDARGRTAWWPWASVFRTVPE